MGRFSLTEIKPLTEMAKKGIFWIDKGELYSLLFIIIMKRRWKRKNQNPVVFTQYQAEGINKQT